MGTMGAERPWRSQDALTAAVPRCVCYHTSTLRPSDGGVSDLLILYLVVFQTWI
jgi:hypothetical protein